MLSKITAGVVVSVQKHGLLRRLGEKVVKMELTNVHSLVRRFELEGTFDDESDAMWIKEGAFLALRCDYFPMDGVDHTVLESERQLMATFHRFPLL